jgi:hypothetical protein
MYIITSDYSIHLLMDPFFLSSFAFCETMNMGVQISVWRIESWVAEKYGNFVFNILRKHTNVFHSGYTCSNTQGSRCSKFLLTLISFLKIDILMGRK